MAPNRPMDVGVDDDDDEVDDFVLVNCVSLVVGVDGVFEVELSAPL